MPWAIATSSRPEEAVASVGSLGLAHHPLVIDGSDVEHAKPAPDLLLKGAHQLDVAPQAAWYVGDSRWDMLAAVAAGMTAVGIASGATSEADLRAAGAAMTFSDLARFLDHVTVQAWPPAGAGELRQHRLIARGSTWHPPEPAMTTPRRLGAAGASRCQQQDRARRSGHLDLRRSPRRCPA